MDLSPTDILKSETIGAITNEMDREQYAQKWEIEEEDLGRDPFRELFAHIRTIYSKVKPKKTLLEEFREIVQPAKNPCHFIDKVLLPYSDAYEYIRTAGYVSSSRADEINDLFRWLNQIDNFDWVPPAILFLSRNRNDPDALIRFFTDLERLAAGMMITRVSLNERLRRYGQVLEAIEQDANLYAPFSPLQLSPAECKAIVHVLDGDLYLIKPRLYVLLRLDTALTDAGSSYKHSIISVEHVLPQNPRSDSDWMHWFPTQELRDQYLHRVGNLALLSRKKNSQAQNYDFGKKKTQYFTGTVANFALTNQVLQAKAWAPPVIEQRQHMLVDKMREIWRL